MTPREETPVAPKVSAPRLRRPPPGGKWRFRMEPDGSLVLERPDGGEVRWTPESTARIAKWMDARVNVISMRQRSGALQDMILPGFRRALDDAIKARRNTKTPDQKAEKRLLSIYRAYPEITSSDWLTKQERGRFARLRAKIRKEMSHGR